MLHHLVTVFDYGFVWLNFDSRLFNQLADFIIDYIHCLESIGAFISDKYLCMSMLSSTLNAIVFLLLMKFAGLLNADIDGD